MMIGSATRTTTGKKVIGIFVAIAMVLTMSNISAYYASATTDDTEVQATEETATDEKVEKVETTEPAATADEGNGAAVPDGSGNGNESDDNNGATDTDTDTDNGTGAGDESTDPADEGGSGDEGDGNATEDDDNAWSKQNHHITVTLELYKNGNRVTQDSKTEEGSIGMNVEFDVDAYIASMKNWNTSNGYAQETTDSYGTIVLKSGWASVEKTIKLYYSPDENGDGIADKYQTTVTYVVENGAWADGTKAPKTQVVTFMDNGKPSNGKDAWSSVLQFPEVGANPDEDFVAAGNWNEKPELLTSYTENPVFTYAYEPDPDENTWHAVNCKVQFFLDGKAMEEYTDNVSIRAPFAEPINYDKGIVEAAAARVPIGNAVLDYVGWEKDANGTKTFDSNGLLSENGTYTLPARAETVSLGYVNVYFDSDVIGTSVAGKSDGIADKYQIAINFNVENGRLANSDDATKVVTLMNDGKPSKNGTAEVALPSVKPADGYFSGSWKTGNKSYSGTVSGLKKADDGITFTYTFLPQSYEYYVMYFDDVTSETIWETAYDKAKYGSTIKAADVVREIPGYVYSWTNVPELTIDTFEQGNGIGLFYDKDANNDGIADKYQVTVTYTAVNGTVTGEATEIVTLYDQNGNFSINGTGHLTHIPTFAPLEGYEGGTWGAAGQPTGYTPITKNTNFVITYTAKVPVVTDEDPTEPDDNDNGTTDNNGSGAGVFSGVYNPDATDTADEATEPEADGEAAIADDQNPLAAPADEADQQTIADDENALAGYEEGSEQTWLPFAIVAGVLCAGLLLFLVARRKRDEEDARSAY